MIILDTHIWIWWVDDNPKLSTQNRQLIKANQASGLGISIISCWEIAKLVEKNRLIFKCPVEITEQLTSSPAPPAPSALPASSYLQSCSSISAALH